MPANYRIKDSADGQFTLIDASGKEVGFYGTKDAAEQDRQRAMKDDVMWGEGAGTSGFGNQGPYGSTWS